MKTLNSRDIINTTCGAASKISASISSLIAALAKEIMSLAFPAEEPQRARVAVRVEHNPLPYRDSH